MSVWSWKVIQGGCWWWQWQWLLWLLCQLVCYLQFQMDQGSIGWKWKTKWSQWNYELMRYEDLVIWELDIRIYCLCKRGWQLKDGWHCRMSRLKLNPWQLLPPRKSWWMFCLGFDGGNHSRPDWGSSSDNCCSPQVSCPSTSRFIGVDGVISLVWCNGCETTLVF